ncbi:MAG TPA: hypothetical protein PLP17_05790, partial [Oligoflexia bacterium]|nr:hypothetical protein [Oligoflexia bacterium]
MSVEKPSYSTLLLGLAEAYGILPWYWDIHGRQILATDETRVKLLSAMGVSCADEDSARRSLEECRRARRARVLEPVVVAEEGQPVRFAIRILDCWLNRLCRWSLSGQGQKTLRGELVLSSFTLQAQEAAGSDLRLVIDVEIPACPAFGYYDLRLEFFASQAAGAPAGEDVSACALLIVPPPRCFIPADLQMERGLLGLSA